MSYWRQPLDRERVQVPRGIVHIIDERCKGCGFCVEFCPQHVLVMSHRSNAKGYHPPELVAPEGSRPEGSRGGDCVNCGLCALLCPDFAIYVDDGGLHVPEQVHPIHRDEARGYSGEARGYSGEARGYSGEARGYSGEARGYSGEARGYSGEARGYSGEVRR